ncbi:MAG: serine/threonine-protein phosphatase [Polyangiaceae bacterium]|nr:serine/threonine-protein phosphatase [Polyangiaceae bacterium]
MVRVSPAPTSLRLRAVGASEPGRVRSLNEDRLLIREDLQLFLVADGAGGHAAGDLAASIAALSVANFIEATVVDQVALPEADRFGVPKAARWLARAVHKANQDVYEIATDCAPSQGMGSTVVTALFAPTTGQLQVAHVGDSRCYRARHGHCEALTRDHSLAQDVLEEHPEIDEKVLGRLPRNVVTRALGMAPTTRVSVGTFDVLPRDRYLLCSDGLSSYVPHEQIAAILAEPRPTGATVQLLLNAADSAGAPDNVTVIVIECPEVDPDGARREERRRSLDRESASQRALDASAPEIFLVGIEDLDLPELIGSLALPDPESSPERPVMVIPRGPFDTRD